MRGPRQPQVGQMQRSSHEGGRLPEHKRKPPAEINTLLYMFQSSFQIPLCFLYCSVSIPVPIVTRLHGNSCVTLAEAMIWSSRRSSWTLPRGPDLRGSSANPHQGAEALQIICVNFYGKCLCKVMHIDLHLCFMQGWRYACARWTSISFGRSGSWRCWAFLFLNALVQCLILNLSICSIAVFVYVVIRQDWVRTFFCFSLPCVIC